MADEVDAAMIMDFDRAYELAEPFLTRGKPVFICSPVAVSVPECERILDLAERHGAAVHTGACSQSLYENRLRNDVVRRENIASFFASTVTVTGSAFRTRSSDTGTANAGPHLSFRSMSLSAKA